MSNYENPGPHYPVSEEQPTQIKNGDISEITADVELMIHYAVNKGIPIPVTIKSVEKGDILGLINNYNTMIAAIAPATVQSINYVNSKILMPDKKYKLLQVPIFTKCLIISFISLVCLIGVSLSPEVNAQNQEQGLLLSSGRILFLNLLFICSASLLGVMFFLLKTISSKIKSYTLLPVDSIELDSTILIGVISGFIIAELFSFSTPDIAGSIEINKMTLALLGGFSSDAIFSVLQGIVNKFKLLVNPG